MADISVKKKKRNAAAMIAVAPAVARLVADQLAANAAAQERMQTI